MGKGILREPLSQSGRSPICIRRKGPLSGFLPDARGPNPHLDHVTLNSSVERFVRDGLSPETAT
jgi:hypothetical protein